VRRLGCLRGIRTLTGFALAVEIGDWHRVTGATIDTFVGLVPSEYSSGQSKVRGSITKTGTPTSAGCWSKQPGTTGPATASARPCGTVGTSPQPRRGSAATKATTASTSGG
jgi:hypothetical protein